MLKLRPLLVLALLASACSSDPVVSPPVSEIPHEPGFVEVNQRARIDMTVTGAESVSLRDREVELHIVEILEHHPVASWFFSISSTVVPPVVLSDGSYLRFTADLSPGLYSGPGRTYTMRQEGGESVPGVPNIGSAAYVEFQRMQPKVSVTKYYELAQPCTMTIGKKWATGSVDCPKLTTEDGKAVSVRWRWTLL